MTRNYKELENHLAHALRLARRPVAVTFRETPPGGRVEIYRRRTIQLQLLAAGRRRPHVLYRAGRPLQLPRRCFTHNIARPDDCASELDQTLQLMTGIGYIQMKDIPDIFRFPSTPVRPLTRMCFCLPVGPHP
ncbi:MAG: hypothetical protein DMG58_08580 [Acidobacteria bacterium]|nr:MAG: hypothetical protein DMG58_08580 [Acidobacteriota bacterium]